MSSSTMIIVGISSLLILIIAITVLLIGRREEIPIEEEEVLPDDVWAKKDEDSTDDVLAEMAGLQAEEPQQWSDADLLDAGWTQEQIDTYRSQENAEEE